MQFRASLVAAAGLFALANARIIGIAFPEAVKAGDRVDAIIETEGYIQSVTDVAIAFGMAPKISAYPGTLGQNVLGSFYLGPEKSNTIENITQTVTVPSDLADGQYVFAAGLYSLYGASSSTTLSNYNVTITVCNVTSDSYVSSRQ
ncbi:hypothetical protein CGRA01v4_00422 [Colletotrichum graminicola]|uniref:Secreted protein NIS1 n=1 Tax=Colletotrichum graminicola (strain M1.001 / M2 / FGSC 10212) TaxID=645133 RepID=E3QH32_COLGM|nr:uncharacterized protein GLRG_05338 [Colletotrichum graminicola M1.001]EFQ30194.1 hypothetical protein GLRG_05338 [Colletotrichum graminicola M1.001]WDK09144.1 hypothetical protein CGRA01v4_00422 [Colletotrichum graminicola]